MTGPGKILQGVVRPTFFLDKPVGSVPPAYSNSAASPEAAKNASTSAMFWVWR
jgi:hypothetical protein